ncbi:MAG: hypothetical protein JXA33_28805 [Anaerolineae bacterium]|nr:hypothetical protein [Anaerolineae bacterium]
MKVDYAQTIDPIVDCGTMPGNAHRNTVGLAVRDIFTERALIPLRIELIHKSAMEIPCLTTYLDHPVNRRAHILCCVAVDLGDPLQWAASGQVLGCGLDHVRGLVVGDHRVNARFPGLFPRFHNPLRRVIGAHLLIAGGVLMAVPAEGISADNQPSYFKTTKIYCR